MLLAEVLVVQQSSNGAVGVVAVAAGGGGSGGDGEEDNEGRSHGEVGELFSPWRFKTVNSLTILTGASRVCRSGKRLWIRPSNGFGPSNLRTGSGLWLWRELRRLSVSKSKLGMGKGEGAGG